ncbi:MAG: molecular chaperone DnaJ [Lachnospiraceae bacterium]|nr:molecular chaperone DnaJ [Lachnospiraceae bacterium]
MSQNNAGGGADEVLNRMLYNETVELELSYRQKTLAAERRHVEEERQKLYKERMDFDRYRETETKRIESDKRLFEMKWKILEEETRRLADERRRVEKQRKFYEQVKRELEMTAEPAITSGDMFFIGVNNEVALKRRYRDLLKIYHPDNLGGDTDTIQEINREYDCLRQKFA